MGRPKREAITVSFHHLSRIDPEEEGEPQVAFTKDDFRKLVHEIKNQKVPNLAVKDELEAVRFGKIIPFSEVEERSSRLTFFKFTAPYSGHSFLNSEKGKISKESVNQRTFNAIIYLSDDGKIHVGAQYLGTYGGWTPLVTSLKRILGQPSSLKSVSYRNEMAYLDGAIPKELQVTINKQPKDIAGAGQRRTKFLFATQRIERGDHFENDTKQNIVPLYGQEPKKIRARLAEELVRNGLTEVTDADIEGCVLVAEIDGREKRFYFLDSNGFATKFPVDVGLDEDGHPVTDQVRTKMFDLLQSEIIAKLVK